MRGWGERLPQEGSTNVDSEKRKLLDQIDNDADNAVESLDIWRQYSQRELLWASLEASFRILLCTSLEHDEGTPEYGAARRDVTDWLDIVFCESSKCSAPWRPEEGLSIDIVWQLINAQPVLRAYSEIRWFMPQAFHKRVSCDVSGNTVSIDYIDDYARRRHARAIAAERAASFSVSSGSKFWDLVGKWSTQWSEAVSSGAATLANECTEPVYQLPNCLRVRTRELAESTLADNPYLDQIAYANNTSVSELRQVVGLLVGWAIERWHAYRDAIRIAVQLAGFGLPCDPPTRPGVRLIPRSDLIDWIVQETKVSQAAADFFVSISTTTEEAGHILAQPLVGFQADDTDWLLLSPSLIKSSWFQLSLPAAAEKAEKIPGRTRDTKALFAHEVASLLRSVGWLAVTNLDYTHDGRAGEIDVLCVDPVNREVLVVECKDLMPVHSPGTLRSVDGWPKDGSSEPTNLMKGIQQALSGAKYVRENWSTVCQAKFTPFSPSSTQAPNGVAPLVVARWNIGSHALDDRYAPVVVLAQLANGLGCQEYNSPKVLWNWLKSGAGVDLDEAVFEQVQFKHGNYTYRIPCVHLP